LAILATRLMVLRAAFFTARLTRCTTRCAGRLAAFLAFFLLAGAFFLARFERDGERWALGRAMICS
jgi:hypothetical protein